MRKNFAYVTVMSNLKEIGQKKFASIPAELLFSDGRFQRTELSSEKKINSLIRNWNPDKMDALRVVAHPEEGRFSIVDGDHRFRAGKIVGMEMFPCEVIQFNGNVEDRLVFEATLFATQLQEVEQLSCIQKHKANLIRGIKANEIIEKMIQKYKIDTKESAKGGRYKAGTLSGFKVAVRIADYYGEEVTDTIFEIIDKTRWNLETNGYNGNVLKMLANVISLHPEYKREIVMNSVAMLKGKTPDQFISEATVAYPIRRGAVKLTLHLEDMLCKKINGMNPEYKKGIISVTERHIA